jgi:hypothetical protein
MIPNVFMVSTHTHTYEQMELYKPEDIVVGGEVNMFGRAIFVYVCDEFTIQYSSCVLDRKITVEQIERTRAEAPTDLYIDQVSTKSTANMQLTHRNFVYYMK